MLVLITDTLIFPTINKVVQIKLISSHPDVAQLSSCIISLFRFSFCSWLDLSLAVSTHHLFSSHRQRQGEFKVRLSDVLMAWKHLLLDKLHLPAPGAPRLENFELFLEAYQSFLKRSNTVDLTDVLAMNKELRAAGSDPEEPLSAVSRSWSTSKSMFYY